MWESPTVTAVVVFVAVALGTVSIALLVEWLQEWHRGRNVVKKLYEFSEESFGAEAQSLLRQTRAAGWLEQVALTIPRLQTMSNLLARAGTQFTVSSYLLLSVGVGIALGMALMIFTRNLLVAGLAVPIGALFPYLVVRRIAKRRVDKIEEQLPDAIDLVGRAMRAGHPLNSGFKMVSEEAPEPIATEFRQVFEQQRFGLPVDDSLLGFGERIPITDVRIFVTAILIHRQVGGNLAEVLDNIAGIVRERFKLRRQLRVITAQGRMSGYVLATLPILLGLALFSLNRDYMLPLFEEQMGRYMLVGAFVFQIMGYLWIRKILDIEF